MFLSLGPFRFIQMVMIFDSSLRNFYYKHFPLVQPVFILWNFTVFSAIFFPLERGYRGCIHM